MQKIELAGLLPEEEKILDILKKEGLLDIRSFEIKREIDPSENQEARIANIRGAISFIEKFSKTRKSMLDSLIPPKFDLKKEAMAAACKDFDCKKILNKIRELDQEISNLHSLKNSLNQNRAALMPFKKLEAPLDHLNGSRRVGIITGSIRTKLHRQFEISLRALSPYLETEVLEFKKADAYIAVYFLSQERNKIEKFISASAFVPVKLLSSAKTPAQELSNIEYQLKNAAASEAEFIKEAKELKKHEHNLMILHDLLTEEQQNFDARSKSAATNYTFVVQGWIKASDFEKIVSRLPNTAAVFKIEPGKDEKIPVAIENRGMLSPFQLIVSIFGTPDQSDIEPTFALTPFFILFFGICLSDAGYGLLLALLSLFLLKKLKLPPGGKKLVILLLFGGIITIPVGILTGSYFGFSAKEMPAQLSFLKGLQIIDAVKNPLVIMAMSLGLGVTQILFGLFLEGVKKIKEKDFTGAILDNLLWILFLGSLVSLFIIQSPFNKNAAIILAILLVLTQGRSEKNIIKKFLMGLLSLYRVSGFMGDTLSYSRLLALMMSTSIIGMVINLIAQMTKDSIPVLGYVFMAAILIFGHLFNLVISTMSAFIHSMRLQLVEFFSKFFVGGGIEFKPFHSQTKYVNIINEQ